MSRIVIVTTLLISTVSSHFIRRIINFLLLATGAASLHCHHDRRTAALTYRIRCGGMTMSTASRSAENRQRTGALQRVLELSVSRIAFAARWSYL